MVSPRWAIALSLSPDGTAGGLLGVGAHPLVRPLKPNFLSGFLLFVGSAYRCVSDKDNPAK